MVTIDDMINRNIEEKPDLSFDQEDIEKRLGMPSGKFTSPSLLLPLIMAIVGTLLFYGLLLLPGLRLLWNSFTDNPVSYAIVFFSAWAAAILIIKRLKLSLQQKALRLDLIPPDAPGFTVTASSAEQLLKRLYNKVDSPQRFLLIRRIHNALSNLKNIGRVGDVKDILQAEAENDEAQMDSSYTFLQGLVWAIPVLGFIGTVLGLSVALGEFGSVLDKSGAGSDMSAITGALQDVTGGLATAFQTTLQGLVAALFIHMTMIGVKRSEEQFLDLCSEYCQKHIIARIKLIMPESEIIE